MGTRRIRIANLPPETSERAIRMALAPYGEIVALHDEVWSKMNGSPVANGIRVATMKLDKHLPSHMVIAGDRAIVSCEGQSVSCYACGGNGETDSPGAEGAQTQSQSGNELAPFNPFQPRDAIWHHAFHLFLICMPFAHWLQ